MKIPDMESPSPPVSDAGIIRLEQRIGYQIPPSYLQFLRECNGGYVEESNAYYYKVPQGFDAACVGVRNFYSLLNDLDLDDYEQLEVSFESYRERVPDDLLPIACDSFGNQICIGLYGDRLGEIVFWNHEIEGEDMYSSWTQTISPSLEYFLDNLGSYKDE